MSLRLVTASESGLRLLCFWDGDLLSAVIFPSQSLAISFLLLLLFFFSFPVSNLRSANIYRESQVTKHVKARASIYTQLYISISFDQWVQRCCYILQEKYSTLIHWHCFLFFLFLTCLSFFFLNERVNSSVFSLRQYYTSDSVFICWKGLHIKPVFLLIANIALVILNIWMCFCLWSRYVWLQPKKQKASAVMLRKNVFSFAVDFFLLGACCLYSRSHFLYCGSGWCMSLSLLLTAIPNDVKQGWNLNLTCTCISFKFLEQNDWTCSAFCLSVPYSSFHLCVLSQYSVVYNLLS